MLKKGDEVKRKFSSSEEIGIILDVLENEEYFIDFEGNQKVIGRKGDYKVNFKNSCSKCFNIFKEQELSKV